MSEQDGLLDIPCVGSGECCKARPCGFGEPVPGGTACRHLVAAHQGSEVTIYRCGIHDYIVTQPGHEFMPAFGAGCCRSLFNEPRLRILRVLREGRDSDAARALGWPLG